MKNIFFAGIGLVIMFFCGCKKETFITGSNVNVSISTDSVKFDTVFTTAGSITQSFKIFNNNDQKILFSTIKLAGGSNSPFKININGVATPEASNLEVAANDSIYVFVSVTANPGAANMPFILSDSILINYNGNTQLVQLEAYGQNAVFLNNTIISSNTNWSSAIPYVILGSLQVTTNATLTIPAGTKIFAHANAPIFIDGTLITNGTADERITFTGDRLDAPYNSFPASWPGIYFRENSSNNRLLFTVIKNAKNGVIVQQPAANTNPKLMLHQCIIDNASDTGLLCINSFVQADNTLISNCGANIALSLGGTYSFTNCTVAGYSNKYLLRKSPVLSVANFKEDSGSIVTADIDATFINCIFWGDDGTIENEIDVQKQGTNAFAVTLDHCIYKASAEPANTTLIASLNNIDPEFDTINFQDNLFDFHTTKSLASPVTGAGTATGFLKDLDNNNRNPSTPDIGCYETQ